MVFVGLNINGGLGARFFKNSYSSLHNSHNYKLLSSSVLWRSSNKSCTSFKQRNNCRSTHKNVKTVNPTSCETSHRKSSIPHSPTFLVNKDLWFEAAALDSLPRRELQKLCKKFGIRAISKTEQLIEDIQVGLAEHLEKTPSES